jgi:hypothetical protein
VDLVKERLMADEHAHQPVGTAANGPAHSSSASATHDAVSPPDEGGAKEILKDAITKVMEEISHHEKEAKRHVKQAESLKRDLRESFAFLQEKRAAKHRGDTTPDTTSNASEPAAASAADATTPSIGRSARRKRRGRRGKKA